MKKSISIFRMLGVVVFILMIHAITGCFGSHSCSQDYLPPTEITTNDNPYRVSILSSNLSIVSARWLNVTTGAGDVGNITQVYECVFPVGCGTWTRIEWYVALDPGLNTVYVYKTSDGCEWREDYLITYN